MHDIFAISVINHPDGANEFTPPHKIVRATRQSVSEQLTLDNLGINHCSLPPGAISALKHYHTQNDEFVLVISGHPTLWLDGESRQLSPGQCVGFKACVPIAHQLVNETDVMVELLEISSKLALQDAIYPQDSEDSIRAALDK